MQGSTHPRRGWSRGQDARKSKNRWVERYWTYLCNFLHLFLLSYFITAAHFLKQQPENDSCLPVHLFKPHYLQTPRYPRWRYSNEGVLCDGKWLRSDLSISTLMSHCTSNISNNLFQACGIFFFLCHAAVKALFLKSCRLFFFFWRQNGRRVGAGAAITRLQTPCVRFPQHLDLMRSCPLLKRPVKVNGILIQFTNREESTNGSPKAWHLLNGII